MANPLWQYAGLGTRMFVGVRTLLARLGRWPARIRRTLSRKSSVLALPFLPQYLEARTLIRSEDQPHSREHQRPRLVQVRARRLDPIDLTRQQRLVGAGLNQTRELRVAPVEVIPLLAQLRKGALM